jgi:uncharacterized RDD family membrane protein YckC
MKCPKCHYLSFDPEPRCRNCGYDLEFADGDLELRLTSEAEDAPPVDLELRRTGGDAAARDRAPRVEPARSPSPAVAVLTPPAPLRAVVERPVAVAERPVAAPPPPAPAARPPRAAATTSELPLFIKAIPDPAPPPSDPTADPDAPLVTLPAQPRTPLSVRRRVVDAPRPSTPPSAEQLKLDRSAAPPAADQPDVNHVRDTPHHQRDEARQVRAEARALVRAAQGAAPDSPGPGLRLAAAVIDSGIAVGLAAVVTALTLRVCGLSMSQAAVLPLAPVFLFILILVTGYLLLFTIASGQTIGKMAMGLKVVDAEAGAAERLSVSQAALRAVLTLTSVLPLGAGFVPALMGDGLALHDRLARTRVVRA